MESPDNCKEEPPADNPSTVQLAQRSCNNCLRKTVCILYYTELDTRFDKERSKTLNSKDLIQIINQLDNELSYNCQYYLEKSISKSTD